MSEIVRILFAVARNYGTRFLLYRNWCPFPSLRRLVGWSAEYPDEHANGLPGRDESAGSVLTAASHQRRNELHSAIAKPSSP